MAVTLIAGNATWKRPTSRDVARIGWPSTIRPTSKLVPPMSLVMMFLKPSRSPSFCEASTPPAGPEVSRLAAWNAASRAGSTPPPDSMMEIGPS